MADKKAGIEQLAARHKWIDLDRVGIYGHSGGGFLTAAAMMLPPYNEFFKVGVSESGNHDNNIYNQNWSEQYHGLKVIAKKPAKGTTAIGDASHAEPDEMADSTFEIRVRRPSSSPEPQGNLLLETGDWTTTSIRPTRFAS